jgi:hypothetical protein
MAKRNTDPEPSTLETIVKLIAPIFLIFSIFLVSRKMITGNVIGYTGYINTIPVITILLIALIFFIAIEVKRKRKK